MGESKAQNILAFILRSLDNGRTEQLDAEFVYIWFSQRQ